MAPALEALSYALPMSYAFDALERVTADGLGGRGWLDVAATIGATLLALVLKPRRRRGGGRRDRQRFYRGSRSKASAPIRTSSPGLNLARSSAAMTPISRSRCSR